MSIVIDKKCCLCGKIETEIVKSDFLVEVSFNTDTQQFDKGHHRPQIRNIDTNKLQHGINIICSNRTSCTQRQGIKRKRESPFLKIKQEDAIAVSKILNPSAIKHTFMDLKDGKKVSIIGSDKYGSNFGGAVVIYFNGNIFWESSDSLCVDNKIGIRYLKAYKYLESRRYCIPEF